MSSSAFTSLPSGSPTMSTAHSSPSLLTSSTPTARVTQDSTSPLFPFASPVPDSSDSEFQGPETMFNYSYFVILAVFGVLVAAVWWCVRQRRMRRNEQMRLSGQQALAQDLDGWVNTRRWMNGAWRHSQATPFVRREEGLNEHGEAPPPYNPKNDVATAEQNAGTAQDPSTGLTIPMRALSRDNIEALPPPQYQEAANRPVTGQP